MSLQSIESEKSKNSNETYHHTRSNLKIKKWTPEEDNLLLFQVEKFNFSKWNKIAAALEGRTVAQCYERHRKIKPELKKGPWAPEEDEAIIELMKTYGKKWSKISKIIKSRTGKQIRERFYNAIDQKINKEKFTNEEENILISMYSKYGPSWSLISQQLPGRTSNIIKNRFYSYIQYIIDSSCCNNIYTNSVKEIKEKENHESLTNEDRTNYNKFTYPLINKENSSTTKKKRRSENSKLKPTNSSRMITKTKKLQKIYFKILKSQKKQKDVINNYENLDSMNLNSSNNSSTEEKNMKVEEDALKYDSILYSEFHELYKLLNENESDYLDFNSLFQ